ncbi:Citrate synthase, peroxisomal [Chlamydiales bacterium SCGC AG-110-P3]|nr:Citrate synthase, peroxisomal [Chlamydiales bacterium SCGC AG-110-P3]
MSDVIFEITDEHLETGMRGFPVGYCTTSTVDPQKGLYYMGRPVAELAGWRPEQVIYLLYKGEVGSAKDVDAFAEQLSKRSPLKQQTVDAIRNLPRNGHPMKLFSIALMLTGMLEGAGDYKEDSLNLVAKVPLIVAHVINHHAGWGGCRPSNPELGYMENFAQMLNVPDTDLDRLTEAMLLFNVLHYDHGGGNLSTFVGKATASGLEDMWGAITSAMNALAGPRHGKANQDCLEFVKLILERLGKDADADSVETLIRERLANKELIYGFGHAVLRVEDVRATVQYAAAEEKYHEHPLVKMALILRKVGVKVLKENPKVSNPYPNVDAISGTLLTAAGFPFPEYYTVLFGLSRSVGIARQIVYERTEARNGKGTPIIRPKYFFKEKNELITA